MKRNWNIRLAGLFATGSLLLLAGCSSGVTKNAEQMTSFSGGARRNDTAQLFTVPAEQMSHVQVATVTEAPLQRTLRLAGSVAYNAFRTTHPREPGRFREARTAAAGSD
jgi:membrane fusion protein, heavy metal efflux system